MSLWISFIFMIKTIRRKHCIYDIDDDDDLRRRLLCGRSAGTTGWCQGSGRAPQWAGKGVVMVTMMVMVIVVASIMSDGDAKVPQWAGKGAVMKNISGGDNDDGQAPA